jgi:hypothetical protein
MPTKQKNDNTLKFLGHLYQGMIALEYCLDGKEGDCIKIEQHGDVASQDEQVEVKSHIDPKHTLSDRHIDFWKTLKNFVENYEISMEYSKLILLTTSVIKENSKWNKWNEKTKEEKFEVLQKIIDEKITETIRPFTDFIFDKINKCKLLKILDKFSIKYGQHRIKEKLDYISNKPNFDIIPKKNRKHLISNLLGYILSQACELDENNKGNWEIDITEFKERLRRTAKSYINLSVVPLPTQFENKKGDRTVYEDYKFVEAIKEINYEKQIQQAIDYFLQANTTRNLLITDDYRIAEDLENYEIQLIKSLEFKKEEVLIECETNGLKEIRKKSKLLLNKCMHLDIEKINGIFDNKYFFQRGSIHIIVNDEKFNWLINKSEI